MLGKAIAARRRELKMTQEELAEAVGLARGTLAQLEIGVIEWPRPETLQRLAAALQTTIPWLLRKAGIIPPTDDEITKEIAELLSNSPDFAELFKIVRESPEMVIFMLEYARFKQARKEQ